MKKKEGGVNLAIIQIFNNEKHKILVNSSYYPRQIH